MYLVWPGPAVIKLFSCPSQLSMKLIQLIYIKMAFIRMRNTRSWSASEIKGEIGAVKRV